MGRRRPHATAPRRGQLRHRHTLLRRDRLEILHERQVLSRRPPRRIAGCGCESRPDPSRHGCSSRWSRIHDRVGCRRQNQSETATGIEHTILGSRVQSEYSLCSAVTGWTAWARSMVADDASEMPRCRTLPASTSDFMAPQVSSIATVRSTRCGSTGRSRRRRVVVVTHRTPPPRTPACRSLGCTRRRRRVGFRTWLRARPRHDDRRWLVQRVPHS